MYTLGVNGWYKGTHDPSAALFKDGNLVVAVEEERLLRAKRAFNKLPYNAIRYCLEYAGISEADIRQIACGWDLNHVLAQDTAIDSVHMPNAQLLDIYFPKNLFPLRQDHKTEVTLVPHHLAHAQVAQATCPFQNNLVIVVDGSAEYDAVSVYKAGRGKIMERLARYPIRASLGIFYQALTIFVGLGSFQEGKTMGLASYGKPIYEIDEEFDLNAHPGPEEPLKREQDGKILERWIARFEKICGHEPFKSACSGAWMHGRPQWVELNKMQKDLAASGQLWVQKQLGRIVDYWMDRSGLARVILSGGVALNSTANGMLLENLGIEHFNVGPFPHDSGVSIGAACKVLNDKGVSVSIPLNGVYCGTEYKDAEIYDMLKGFGIPFKEMQDPPCQVAKEIAKGKVCARFDGRMEFGMRALGNRSILALPSDEKIKHRVNDIKLREPWRPLAPSFKEEQVSTYYEQDVVSPFMSYTVKVKDALKEKTGAVIHVDGTSRLQTVSADLNPDFWSLIDEMEKVTGVPAVLNTSFNIGYEPIVSSPTDAVRSFFSSKLDVLALGGFIIDKEGLYR